MAVYKATKKKMESGWEFKATENRTVDTAMVYGWEKMYNESYDALEKYRKRIEEGEYLSSDDLSAYEKAMNSYVDAASNMSNLSKSFGKDVLDDKAWDESVSQMRDNFKAVYDHYSRFDSKEKYDSAVAANKDYEEKKNLDIEAAEQEIRDYEEALEAYSNTKGLYWEDYYTSEEERQAAVDRYLAYFDKYGVDPNAYENEDERDYALAYAIRDRRAYVDEAKRIQEGIKLASVADPASELYDPEFGQHSEYVDQEEKFIQKAVPFYKDVIYDAVNNNESGSTLAMGSTLRSLTASDFARLDAVKEMNDEERSLYNYYYAKHGYESAEKYLDSIMNDLNYRMGEAIYKPLEDKWALEMLFGVVAGLDQFVSGVKGFGNAITGNDDYVPPSAVQYASGMVREDLSDIDLKWYNFKEGQWDDAKIFGNSLGQVGYDSTTTTANMLPSILVSAAANYVVPGSGAVVGSTLLGASASGNAYQEMINLGYDKGQARAYAALVGGSEAGLQYLMGGVGKLGGKLTGNAIGKIVSGVDNAFARTAIKLGGNMLSEGIEEGLQEILTPWFQNLTLHTDNDVNWNDVAYSSLLGALTAGFMEGGGTIATEVGNYKTGKALQAADISAQRLADIGKTFSADTVAYQLAGRVNENTGAYTMGRLFNEIGASLSEQNVTEITEALVAKGMDSETARKNAKALAYVVEGGQLSEKQIAVIEANEVLAEVARTTLIDANTTWNQRSKGYNEALMALAREKTSTKASRTNPAQQSEANAPESDTVYTEKENAAESDAEAVDTSPQKATSITEIKNGQAVVELEDGSKVAVKDADLSPEDGVRIETIAKIDGLSTEDANFILNTLRTSPGTFVQANALGAVEAYRYGRYGFSKDHMVTKGVFATSLTETQRNAIYETGRAARLRQADRKNTVTSQNKASTDNGKIYFDAGKGNVVEFRYANKKLTAKQDAGVKAAMLLKKLGIGGNIYFFESHLNKDGQRVFIDQYGNEVGAPNGWYSESDGSIHVDLNAGNNGDGFVLFTLSHELTHFIEQWSPEKFRLLADFLIENYEKGHSMNSLVRAKQKRLSELRGKKVSYAEAYSEVVADSMEAMLADGNVMEKLIELKAKDNVLFMKMKQFFDNLLNKIRNIYKGKTPDPAEGRAVMEMTESIEKIQQLFAEALVDASANYQDSLAVGEESVVVNESGDPVAYGTEDGTVMLSMRTYEEDGRAAFRKYLEKCVSSKKLTKVEMQEMLDGIEDIYQTCKEFKDKYAPFSTWSDAAVVRDTYGKPVFSVVTPNGDYKMNLDFSLVCKKRRTLDAVFNEMSKRGIIDDFELGQKSVVKINEIIRKYGLETACALCFVDAKRFRQASMADSFTSLYNELVKSLVPESQSGNIEHFNFSGYDTIAKVADGVHTWDSSKLDFSHIDEVMKNYGTGTVEYKAAKYIKTHPEGRKLLLRGDFMSSKGFDAVKTQNKDILKLYNSKKGTGGPKAAFGDVQYMNEIIKKAKTWTPAKAYEVGGVRIQSFSDYVPRMVFDYTQMIYDLAATKLPAHAYTKEALFVKQFGLTGVKINMILIPAIAEGGIAPGLDADGNYVWAGESFDFETAKEIQNAEGYTENCGTICVGVSHDHIVKLLRDPDIRMVIPYHKSGLNPIVAHMNKIAQFHDYTSDQRTKGNDGKMLDKDFDFSKALHDMGENASPKAVADQYLKWCAAHGYTPRFAEFAMEDNYYKLLEDFTLYDKDGKYVPQREVRAVFPGKNSAFGSMKDLIETGLEEDAVVEGKRDASLSSIVDEIQNTLPKTEAEIAEDQVDQADRDLEAETKLSDRDSAGNQLSKEQQAFFKESKVRDASGKLMIMYHGTANGGGFTVFVGDKLGNDPRTSQVGQGFYFTNVENEARSYMKNVDIYGKVSAGKNAHLHQVYLNITNPFNVETDTLNIDKAKSVYMDGTYNWFFSEWIPFYMNKKTLEGRTFTKADVQAMSKADRVSVYVNYLARSGAKEVLSNMVRAFPSTKQGELLSSMKKRLGHDGIVEEFKPGQYQYVALSPEQIKDVTNRKPSTDPDIRFSYRGKNKDGIEVYETSQAVRNLSWSDRRIKYLDVMKNVYRGRTARFSRNGHTYYAQFDQGSVRKHIYGDKRSSPGGVDALIKAGADGDVFDLVENSQYRGSRTNTKKHTKADYFDYFIKTVQIDGKVFDLMADVEKKYGANDGYVYTIALVDNKKIKASPALGTPQTGPVNNAGNASGNNVTPPPSNVNTQNFGPKSDRDTESVSNRSLLANAFEGIAKDSEKQKLQEYRDQIELIDAEERKLSDLNQQIKDLSFAKGPRDKDKLSKLRDEARKTANRINIFDKQLLRLEASKPLQDVLAREKKKAYQKAEQRRKEALDEYREKAIKTQQDMMDRWKESRKRGIENRERTAMRHKVQSVVGELNSLLLSNDKKRHVPDSLKKAVADALSLVNMDTVAAEERAAKYAALIEKETDPDKIDAYTVTMENILRQGEKMGQRLNELRDAYEEIQESADPDIANAYDPVIAGSLKELSQSIGNTSLRNMTTDQLSDVYDMYRMVLTRVRDANKAFAEGISANIGNIASNVIREVRAAGGEHTYRAAILDPVRKFQWDNLKPVYAMERLGSPTMGKVFETVRAGEDTWAKDVVDARKYYLDQSKKYDYNSWDFNKKTKFKSASGLEFELTLEQILSLYAYSKRDQAADHLRLGGFVFDSNIETYKEKGSKLIKYKVNTAEAHQVTPDILADITGTLTKEQKVFVDEMQDYLSTVMGAKGNEVTMKMYGVKLFKEKFYFPLKSAKQFMFEQNEVSGEVRIKNSGFTNKVVAKANNPVILNNFMDVWAGHVNDMSMYHAFVLPLEDFNRVFNYNSPKSESEPSVSVKGTIQNAYSPAAVSYMKQLITDLNGGVVADPRETFAKSMIAKFKKAKVFSSASVVIQQPSAIGRAFALVDPKYFHFTKDGMKHSELWNEVKQYAPVAIIKEMGYFDTDMGRSTKEFITAKEYSGVKEKAKALFADGEYRDAVLSKAPALADELTWCAIWNAVKRETKAKNPGLDIKSEELLQKAGERFTEVITKTQVYDSVLSRSANMRSKSGLMSMVTSFMAEPTTTINMIEDAMVKAKKGDKRYAAKAFASAAVSVILNNALVALVYGARDDDDDETYLEKYSQAFISNTLDDANPITYYPYLKDMWSILQGYDVERADMSLVGDVADALEGLTRAYTSENGDVAGAWWDIAGSVANIVGIPAQNISRDINGAINLVKTLVEDASRRDTTWGSMGDALGEAVRDSLPVVGWLPGETKGDKLYDAIVNGDNTYVDRLRGGYKDDSSYRQAVRKALRENDPRIKEAAEARVNGDTDRYISIANTIIGEESFDRNDIVAAINAEVDALLKLKKPKEPTT